MEITFRTDSNLGQGSFVQVLRGGGQLGKIFRAAGAYRFYEGDHEKLGGPDLQDADLERLKSAIRSRYGR